MLYTEGSGWRVLRPGVRTCAPRTVQDLDPRFTPPQHFVYYFDVGGRSTASGGDCVLFDSVVRPRLNKAPMANQDDPGKASGQRRLAGRCGV